MKNAKFIVVQDASTASMLIAAGFQVVSQINNTYTFMNMIPKHFKFENIDVNKLVYTNILTF